MAYSLDAREMAMRYLENGHPLTKAERELGVSMTTLKSWKKNLRNNGTLEKAPLERSARKFHDDKVRKFVDKNPFSTLKEIANHFGGTPTGAFHALNRLKITLKKGLQIM